MGAIIKNKLKFELVELHNCSLLGVLDTSVYTTDLIELPTLQVLIPGLDEKDVRELSYYPNEVTILNSNNLGLTSVSDVEDYEPLPDGLWTIKQSICPPEDNWYEKKFYRICQLQCKFYKAFLNLELNKCTSCYSKEKYNKLNTAWIYLQGIQANIADCNFEKATGLYGVADKILDDLIECEC